MKYVTEYAPEAMTLTDDEADKLIHAGLLVESEDNDNEDGFDITALVWDDLGLEGTNAIRFLHAALGREYP